MDSWFIDLTDHFAGHPLQQAVLVGLATFILEDPTTVSCGLLIAGNRMLFWTAFIGLSVGITAGDLGLYAMGRFVGPSTITWGLLSQDRLERVKHWFDRNLVLAVIASRFMPGMRLPTYVGAGIFQASPVRFLVAAIGASILWTFLLLTATIRIGESVLPLFGRFKWLAAFLFVLAIVLVQRRASRKFSQHQAAHQSEGAPIVSAFEFWPPVLFYLPVGLYYAWLAIRFRSFTLPTLANPSIYSGGLIRESKSQILDLVAPSHRSIVARYGVCRRPPDNHPVSEILQDALAVLEDKEISFPIVAKPDIGQRGAGVQRIHNSEDLESYLQAFPVGCDIVLQELVDYPHEAGVLYYRYPGEADGRIFSITLKEFPTVVGDGQHTVRELICADPRAHRLQHIYFPHLAAKLNTVLPEGESLPLVFAGNHAQGAVFRDGTHLATAALLARIEEITSAIPEFNFGRFDVRFADLDQFRRGEGFMIVEINGAGAEATHIWDASQTLPQAYGTLFEQFRVLFEIGVRNRRRGFRALGPIRVLRDCFLYRRSARAYPLSH